VNSQEILIISTAHLSNATNALLSSTDCMDWPVLGGPYRDVGWIFHVDEDAANDYENPAFQDLFAVFRFALERDLFIVLFYDIAEPAAELPLFRDPAYETGNPFLYKGMISDRFANTQAIGDGIAE
jgi:hypothetical protein